MSTVSRGEYEWDAAKASTNVAKHGVTFEEAISALEDRHVLVLKDRMHDDRTIFLGSGAQARLLYVVTTERGFRTRLISARRATPKERRLYQR